MATKDGSTCAHIAASKGSVSVIEELMKFDKNFVISSRNKLTDSTPLHIATGSDAAQAFGGVISDKQLQCNQGQILPTS